MIRGTSDRGIVRGSRAAGRLALALALFLPACGARGTTYTFHIRNHDTLALDSAYIDAGGPPWQVGSVPAGRDTTCFVVLRENALLHLTAIRGRGPFRVILGGYAAEGPDATVEVIVSPGGAVAVGAPAPRQLSSPRRP